MYDLCILQDKIPVPTWHFSSPCPIQSANYNVQSNLPLHHLSKSSSLPPSSPFPSSLPPSQSKRPTCFSWILQRPPWVHLPTYTTSIPFHKQELFLMWISSCHSLLKSLHVVPITLKINPKSPKWPGFLGATPTHSGIWVLSPVSPDITLPLALWTCYMGFPLVL